jgi:FkbM family methyltransferase
MLGRDRPNNFVQPRRQLAIVARKVVGEFLPAQHSEEICVSTVTLDSYLSERHLPGPRCVKIDAEGAEIRILKGATRFSRAMQTFCANCTPNARHAF